MKPLVSVIMPVFNAERHLPESLKTILEQDLLNFELICVDDGSTDSSLDIISNIASTDARIKALTQVNQGPGAARNRGIDLAQGDFICFMDSDDLLSCPSYLSTLYHGAIENNVLVSAATFCNYRNRQSIQTDFSDDAFYAGYQFRKSEVIPYCDYQFDYGFHRFLFNRSLFAEQRNRFNSLTFFEDPVFLARILFEAQSLYTTPQVAYWYRCDQRPIRWTEKKVLDLIEGVRQNLVFSSDNNLPKLHWYTAHHFDEVALYTGVGITNDFDTHLIGQQLHALEKNIDSKMLASISREDANFTPLMRKLLDESANRGAVRSAATALLFKTKRALVPLYRQLTAR